MARRVPPTDRLAPKSITLKISLPPEVVRSIKLEALARDVSPSRLLATIWSESPKQFSLHRIGRRGSIVDGSGGPDGADGPRLADAS